MREFDFINNPEKLLKPEIVQMVGSIHEHKGNQKVRFYRFLLFRPPKQWKNEPIIDTSFVL